MVLVFLYVTITVCTCWASTFFPIPVFIIALTSPPCLWLYLYIFSKYPPPSNIPDVISSSEEKDFAGKDFSSLFSSSKKRKMGFTLVGPPSPTDSSVDDGGDTVAPDVTIIRCVLVQAMGFSGSVLNLFWNKEKWLAAVPYLQPFSKNPLSSPSSTCLSESSNYHPPSMVYLFCGAFFSFSLIFHLSRYIFTSEDRKGRTGTKSIAGFFGRVKGQTGAFHMTCVHIHFCAATQYFLYYLSETGHTDVLGFPSPWHPASKIVPLIRYLTWNSTLPMMAQVPLCFAQCSACEVVAISASGTGVIITGWLSCGGWIPFPSIKWAWVSFWFLASEIFLIKCCYDLHNLMMRTTNILDSKSQALDVSYKALPQTSSLTTFSTGIAVIWHAFPVILFLAEYGQELFPSHQPDLVEAMSYGCIDIMAKAFCTYAIMMSSFIVEEYMGNLLEIEKQVVMEMKLKMEEAFVSFVFHEMRNPFNGMAGHIECAKSSFEELGRAIKGKKGERVPKIINEIGSDLESLITCKNHMSAILNRALDLVRDFQDAEKIVFNLNKLLSDVQGLVADRRMTHSFVDKRTAKQIETLPLSRVVGGVIGRGAKQRAKAESEETNEGRERSELPNIPLYDKLTPHYSSLRSSPPLADSLRLRQVLLNLCTNALNNTNASETDFVKLGIVAEASELQGGVLLEFSVWDSGSGMTAAMIDKVKSSTKFSTRVKTGGVGLGLVISQKLINAMSEGKSSIDVVSPWPPSGGKGSRFSFTLELKVAEEPPLVTKMDGIIPYPSSSALTTTLPKNIRLLVVDDMVMNRKIVTRKLSVLPPFKDLNWVFTTAVNGEEALELLKTEEFDAIWTDEILDTTGGLLLGSDVVRTIRREEAGRRDPKGKVIVISSGNSMDKDHKKYLGVGADFVAGKPTPSADELAELFLGAFRKRGYIDK